MGLIVSLMESVRVKLQSALFLLSVIPGQLNTALELGKKTKISGVKILFKIACYTSGDHL